MTWKQWLIAYTGLVLDFLAFERWKRLVGCVFLFLWFRGCYAFRHQEWNTIQFDQERTRYTVLNHCSMGDCFMEIDESFDVLNNDPGALCAAVCVGIP